MYTHPYILEQVVAARHRELQDAADRRRLIENRPKFRSRPRRFFPRFAQAGRRPAGPAHAQG